MAFVVKGQFYSPTSDRVDDRIVSMGNLIEFVEWLSEEMAQRDWNAQDLSRIAAIHPSHLYRVLNTERNPGPDLCVAIARALKYPPDLVFRKAGILPEGPSTVSPETRQMMALFEQLSDEDQHSLLIMIRALVHEKVRRYGHQERTAES